MGHVLAAAASAELHDMVEVALEGAGFSVAAMVESNLTVELLESTSNPVVVLLNKQASQCILVDVLTQSHPAPSLPTTHVSSAWQQSDQLLRSLVVDRYSGVALEDDVFATRLVESGAWISSSRLGSRSVSRTHRQEYRAQRGHSVWVALTQGQVRIRAAVAHLFVFALLGCLSGLFLRSWWSLAVVPAAYIYGIVVTYLSASSSNNSAVKSADVNPMPPHVAVAAPAAE